MCCTSSSTSSCLHIKRKTWICLLCLKVPRGTVFTLRFPCQMNVGSFLLSIIFLFIFTTLYLLLKHSSVESEQFRTLNLGFFWWCFFSFPLTGAYICTSCDWAHAVLTLKFESLNIVTQYIPCLKRMST